MKDAIESYVGEVMQYVSADEETKKRLAEDLAGHIAEAAEREGVQATIARMGEAKDMAGDIMDALYAERGDLLRELVRARGEARRLDFYEYKSKRTLLGIPLVHVNMSRGYGPLRVARGIVAIGNAAVGVVALGGMSLGLFTLGGLSVGIVALGGVTLGGLALGGVAVGLVALGGVAVGVVAIGGAAVASNVAIGGSAAGYVAVGDATSGHVTLEVHTATYRQVYDAIVQAFPKFWKTLAELLAKLGSSMRQ